MEGTQSGTRMRNGELQEVLRDVWGYDSFRPLQERSMTAVMERRDSLVVLPTGGGKSICFQAPALLREGTAVVVSPLISLMRDQVAQLLQSGVEAGCLHSGQPLEERQRVMSGLVAGSIKLLYLSPERLAMDDLGSLLGGARLSFVAVDEAHCVSMWGHDFRPEYRQIVQLRERFPDADMHAYTATATREVARDIVVQLGLREPVVLQGSFDRPNLFYAAKPRRRAMDKLVEVIRRHPDRPGIVYCISRKETESVADSLCNMGFNAAPYHAGMDAKERRENQDAFVADRVNIVVATIAFGMGINKPDVRFVVHMGMPKTLENYQQEIGRAGRDGLPAECLLLYSLRDLMTWKRILSDAPEDIYAVAKEQLERMHEWASGTTCRRVALLRHFGEKYPRKNCGACDICTGGQPPITEGHIIAQKILSCVKRLEEKHPAVYTAEVLLGSKSRKIVEAGHDQLSTYGLLKGHEKDEVLDWIEQLRDRGFLSAEEGGALTVTEAGWDVLRNSTTAVLLDRMAATAAVPRDAEDEFTPAEKEAFERLRALRKQLAEKEGVPPYVVFSDVTLRDIVRRRPRTLAEFVQVKGVGRKKLVSYGKVFLEAFWDSIYLDFGPMPPPREATRRAKSAKGRAMQHFAEGATIEEAAEQIGRAVSTTQGYLEEYIQNEGIADPSPWVSAELQAAIEAELDKATDKRLRPILDALEGRATFGQIRVVQACRANRGK